MPDAKCLHNVNIDSVVMLNYLKDGGRYTAELSMKCADCGKSFKFLGLPIGLNLNGATVSFDGKTATLAVAPEGEAIPPISGVEGYSIRKQKPEGGAM